MSAPRPGHRWWAVPLIALAGLALVGIAVAALAPSSLVADKEVPDPEDPAAMRLEATPFARVPASAERAADRVSFGDLTGVAAVDAARPGDFYFVTISEPAQSVLSYWVSRTTPEVDFLTREEKYGVATPTERRAISLQMMRSSEQVAQYVALRALGYEDAEIVPGDVVVAELVCLEAGDKECRVAAPADEVLDPGDTLLTAEGVPLETVDDLTAALGDNQPGDIVELEIQRLDEAPRVVEVELIVAPDGSGRTIVGFVPFDTASVRLPFEVDIDTGNIGGPSAGLAFTLTLIDELSEGNLTGGVDVAVTGEIALDGAVGAIGGLPQKVSAVRQIGVDVFLVPSSQSAETLAQAREVAGDDVRLIPVSTLDEALAALEELGGDPIAVVD